MPWARRALALGLVAVLGTACSGRAETPEAGRLPSSDHVHALRVLEDGTLLLGLHGALYRSSDGERWEPAGLEGRDAMAIGAHDPDGPIFVAGHEVLARSRDGGATFEDLRPSDLPGLDIHAFAQAPSAPERIYAFVVGFGLFASEDAGETWALRAELGSVPPDLLALVVVGQGTELLMAAGPESGVLRSEDGGRTFARMLNAGALSLANDPSDPDRLLGITARGLEESRDGGRSWSVLLPRGEALPGQWISVAVGPDGSAWVVTEEPRTLQRTRDGGRSWEEVARA
ncbi:MAG: hypothetical protein M3N51_09170 [Actinomycetota bacterium]|nr:hypothetical protein [Actinomycetota bacterium]